MIEKIHSFVLWQRSKGNGCNTHLATLQGYTLVYYSGYCQMVLLITGMSCIIVMYVINSLKSSLCITTLEAKLLMGISHWGNIYICQGEQSYAKVPYWHPRKKFKNKTSGIECTRPLDDCEMLQFFSVMLLVCCVQGLSIYKEFELCQVETLKYIILRKHSSKSCIAEAHLTFYTPPTIKIHSVLLVWIN